MQVPAKPGRRAVIMTGIASLAAAAPPPAIMPMQVANGLCIVPVILDGRLARMILDTGAARSVITQAAARRLGLRFDPWVDTTLRDAGGRLETHPNADIAAATLGGLPLSQFPAPRRLSLSVAGADLGAADGLLGSDLLRHFTLGLDLPDARLTLAPANAAAPIEAAITLQPLWPDLLLAPVVLDGRPLAALVDTGSTGTLINARGLHRLGLTPAHLAQDQIVTIAGVTARQPGRLHRFANLRIGALSITNPTLLAAYIPEAAFDMILGTDILGRQPLRLSYTQLSLAFTTT